MNSSKKRIVGNIAGFHGVKGEVKIFPLVDDLGLFYNFEKLEIDGKEFEIDSVRNHKNFVLVKFVGYDSLNEVEDFNGHVRAELDEELAADEVYIDDLIGMKVLDQNDKEIGEVSNYYSSGQNLLGIKAHDNMECKREILLPYVADFILELKKDSREIKVLLEEGILELAK